MDAWLIMKILLFPGGVKALVLCITLKLCSLHDRFAEPGTKRVNRIHLLFDIFKNLRLISNDVIEVTI